MARQYYNPKQTAEEQTYHVEVDFGDKKEIISFIARAKSGYHFSDDKEMDAVIKAVESLGFKKVVAEKKAPAKAGGQ